MAEPVEVTPDPAEEYAPPAIGAHWVEKVSARTGIGRHGERIDEKQVAITSNVDDQDVGPDREERAQLGREEGVTLGPRPRRVLGE